MESTRLANYCNLQHIEEAGDNIISLCLFIGKHRNALWQF